MTDLITEGMSGHLSELPIAFGGRATRRGTASTTKGSAPYLGVGDVLGTGDSYLVGGVLPNELADAAFEKMKTEVKWGMMHHRGEVYISL